MNISQALEVPISRVLELLQCKSMPRKGNQQFFYSPFREERTPSFNVNLETNKWYDHGEGIGGDVINLVCHHLKLSGESDTVQDALRWLRNMTGNIATAPIVRQVKHEINDPALILRDNSELKRPFLIRYLKNRGIPIEVAIKYTRQLRVYNKTSNKSFLAIGFRNEDRGWELRHPNFKACISPKAISFVRGKIPKPDEINVFEGFFDFLSLASQSENGILNGDSLILNSISCLEKGLAYLNNYGYTRMNSYMDNDKAGTQAIARLSAFAKTQEGLTHRTMNGLYSNFKDVNAWHMHEQGLKPL